VTPSGLLSIIIGTVTAMREIFQIKFPNFPYAGDMSSQPLLSLALSLQVRLNDVRKRGGISLTGEGLDIAGVVAVARLVRRCVIS
jgi:hypothetical protein